RAAPVRGGRGRAGPWHPGDDDPLVGPAATDLPVRARRARAPAVRSGRPARHARADPHLRPAREGDAPGEAGFGRPRLAPVVWPLGVATATPVWWCSRAQGRCLFGSAGTG